MTIPIEQINPAPYNPRKDLQPDDPEYEQLKRSIAEFGFVEPLVWNRRTGNLVAGHQRLKVLTAQGAVAAECSVVDLDDSREKVLNVALNKIRGDWDMQLLQHLLQELSSSAEIDLTLTGFDSKAIDGLLALDPGQVEFKEYDEGIADDVKKVTCPECGHEFPV